MPKNYVRGSCFDNYTNKVSHKELKEETKRKLDKFI